MINDCVFRSKDITDATEWIERAGIKGGTQGNSEGQESHLKL